MSDIDWDDLPDPLAELEHEIQRLQRQVRELERRLRGVERWPERSRPYRDRWPRPYSDPWRDPWRSPRGCRS